MPSLASEVKQHGVLEAARDPDTKISAEDAEKAVLKEAQKAGGAAFMFDPNASAEEKAAQARSVCFKSYGFIIVHMVQGLHGQFSSSKTTCWVLRWLILNFYWERFGRPFHQASTTFENQRLRPLYLIRCEYLFTLSTEIIHALLSIRPVRC